MPLPRKLVRGQDVWLGKGAEQTRQILKCMWCGQSFRSLAEMTSHMQETQHYTNIISQEQIISWKSSDDKSSSNGGSAGVASPTSPLSAGNTTNVSNSSTVSAVLTCKVCEQAFPSLKELSNHMVKNSHYKEPVARGNSESPVLASMGRGRGRQTREKRKKSLPVRKLLEMERAGQDHHYGKGNNVLDPALKPLRDFAASTKITCEKCGEKIETALFVDHIRQCLDGVLLTAGRQTQQKTRGSPQISSEMSRKSQADNRHLSPLTSAQTDILSPMKEAGDKSNSIPSVLNALEQLIEKSFDIRPTRQNSGIYGAGMPNNTPLGASILKRLGIDDNVDYTKPLMDANSMRFRSNSVYSARDRSASESSSISERCSLLEAATPEHQLDISRQTTPRMLTPEKMAVPRDFSEVKIKTEPIEVKHDAVLNENVDQKTHKISVKKEFNEYPNADGLSHKAVTDEEQDMSKRVASSPSTSERSITPKSSHSDKKTVGSSLSALSCMFDSLNNMTAHTNFSGDVNNNNNNHNNNNNIVAKSGSSKKSNANPLAALKKLCENTTDTTVTNNRSISSTTSTTPTTYNWDAVEAMMKCAYCDTSFYTKGAYRQHLQKVHFIKDDQGREKSPKSNLNSPQSNSKSPVSTTSTPTTTANTTTPNLQTEHTSPSTLMTNNNIPTINPYEESPQSKFRKYTELAKQLSSKNT